MKSLRQRLRKYKIKCTPWKIWKGEIDFLPVSSKTLFAKYGIEIDILEKELKQEGYLIENENLLEVLKIEANLYRGLGKDKYYDDTNFGLFPEDWTEEDYKYK